MSAHGLHGNILDDFDWGSYLIFHCAPRSRVFIDGRAELVYSNHLIDEYVGFLEGGPGSEEILLAYPSDFILIKPETRAYQIVIADPRWKLIYRDATSALFSRRLAPGVAVATARVTKAVTPSLFP
jgi:hypothetical protein